MSRLAVLALSLLVTIAVCQTTLELCSFTGRVALSENQFDSEIEDAPMFIGNAIYVLTTSGSVYRSTDKGVSFSDLSIKLQDWSLPQRPFGLSGVRDILQTADDNKILFRGFGGVIWTTTDGGETFTYHNSATTVWEVFDLHPKQADWLLATSWNDVYFNRSLPGNTHRDLYVSTDFGTSWNLVDSYIPYGQFTWTSDPTSDSQLIWYSKHTTQGVDQNTLGYEDINFGNTPDQSSMGFHSLFSNGVAGFLHYSATVFVALFGPTDSLELYISQDDGVSFSKAIFPTNENFAENRYTVVDTSEGAAFVNVDHSTDGSWGSLYVSDDFDEEYILSLPYNVRSGGAIDFAKINGIDGVLIANVRTVDPNNDDPTTDIVSRISFNKGGDWFPIAAPSGSVCALGACTLNLFGRTTFRTPYTNQNAVGLIIATGNVGNVLDLRSDTIHTFFSRDAGITWLELFADDYRSEYGDHGAITLFADFLDETSTLIYSWTQGYNFTECSFVDPADPMEVSDIISEPEKRSSKFYIQGVRRDAAKPIGFLVLVDFSNYQQRQCVQPDDYESFTPVDNSGTACILGQTKSYTRRKRLAACFNGEEFETNTTIKSCPCSRQDYECEECFKADSNGNCIADMEYFCPIKEVKCENGFKQYTKGYRLVAGDVCITSDSDPYAPTKVACGSASTTTGGSTTNGGQPSVTHHKGATVAIAIIAIIVLVGGIVGGLWYGSKKNDKLRACLTCKKKPVEGDSKYWPKEETGASTFGLDDDLYGAEDEK